MSGNLFLLPLPPVLQIVSQNAGESGLILADKARDYLADVEFGGQSAFVCQISFAFGDTLG
jgi:hypothetical protein